MFSMSSKTGTGVYLADVLKEVKSSFIENLFEAPYNKVTRRGAGDIAVETTQTASLNHTAMVRSSVVESFIIGNSPAA